MKASELRQGNLFLEEVRGHKDEFILAGFNSLTNTAIDKDDNITSIDYLEPIPLTEEWLVKFGFKGQQVYESVSDYWIPDGYQTKGHKVQTDGETFVFMGYKDGIEIEYVHQLQNLYFALTGEELPLNAS